MPPRRAPLLALKPGIAAALFSRNDHQVENRALATALIAACRNAGVELHENSPVGEVIVEAGARAAS